jgi:fructose-1,6-bisphosphatase/inositol monophosphatase family enzyme
VCDGDEAAMSRPPTTDLSLALRLAEMAGDLALPFFEKGVISTPKLDGSPVTEADLTVEAAHRRIDAGTPQRWRPQ